MAERRATIDVLHVDDEPSFAEVVATFLEREDERFDVETATSADEGIDLLSDDRFDCIVSDHDMPGRNGIEFLEAVREDHPDLPFVLFTGKGSEEIASEAISAGVTDYLQKEGGTDQYTVLANRVVNAVERYWMQRDVRRTKARLKRQNDLFEKAQDLADVGAWEYDLRDEGLYWTDEVKRIHGLPLDHEPTLDEAIDFYHPDDRPAIREAFEAARTAGEPYDLELRIETTGGEERWVRTRGEAQYEDGAVVRVRGSIQDVTDRVERERALRESKDRLQLLFDKAPEPMFVHDMDGNFTDVNEAAVDQLGYTREEFLSMRVPDVEVRSDSAELEPMWEDTDFGEYRRMDGKHRRADGTVLPVEVWVSPVEIDGDKRFLVIARDLSERE